MEGPSSTVVNITALFGAVVRTGTDNSLIARYVASCGKEALLWLPTTWSRQSEFFFEHLFDFGF